MNFEGLTLLVVFAGGAWLFIRIVEWVAGWFK